MYEKLEAELAHLRNTFAKAAEIIVDQDVSVFPIFVIHPDVMDIGINIVEKEATNGKWSVNASTLEEFVAKQIVAAEKVEDFKTLYKTHPGDFCLFVLNELGANFIFMPK